MAVNQHVNLDFETEVADSSKKKNKKTEDGSYKPRESFDIRDLDKIHPDFRKFLDNIQELEKTGVNIREDRENNRSIGMYMIRGLTQEYGSLHDIPETSADLHIARYYLGAYDDSLVAMDVKSYRKRVNELAERFGISRFRMMDVLSEFGGMAAKTLGVKLSRGVFTLSERQRTWLNLYALEQRSAALLEYEDLSERMTAGATLLSSIRAEISERAEIAERAEKAESVERANRARRAEIAKMMGITDYDEY